MCSDVGTARDAERDSRQHSGLRARERRAWGTVGVDGISFTVHPWGTRNRWIGILRPRFDMLKWSHNTAGLGQAEAQLV